MSKFKREDKYSEEIIEAARRIRKKCEELNKPILVIPSTDSLIFYYQGKPFLSITNKGNWEPFGKGYDKYFNEHKGNGKQILERLRGKSEDIEQIYEKNLDTILECIAKGLPRDKERASQQVIALNNIRENISSMDNSYFVCGFEAAIPEDYFNNKEDATKPEIDLIAVNIEEEEILLIEYKCQSGALLGKGKNIAKHCEDYLTILDNEDLRNDLKTGMRNAYWLMRKIYMDDKNEESEFKLEFKEIKIAFLITKHPCKEKENGKGNITLHNLITAKNRLDKCIKKYAENRGADKNEKELARVQKELKEDIKCLICDRPEDCRLEGCKNFDKWDEMIKRLNKS